MNKQDFKRKLFSYHTVIVLSVIIGCVFWDLLTKAITDGYDIEVIKNVLSFYSVQNTGGAWSVLSDHTILLTIFSIIAIVGILCYDFFFIKNKTKFYSISLGLILSGAIGNLIDRIWFKYVRDFIRLEFINFPIFNFADMCLVIGVILMCIYLIFFSGDKKEKIKEKVS